MRGRRLGYLTLDDPDAKRLVEIDTVQCVHCSAAIKQHNADGTRITTIATCGNCGHGQICAVCDRVGRCTPLEKRIQEMEARGRLLAAMERG